ncbi:PHP domain-containing protein [Leuconostoc gasicomitatum]|uniref:PHP domain-containing protein n=1 Tax=Leuconostoc gasicomitatum TaxID=115778 RepID=UPI0012662545|nr:PHP domain-containing protein [Leuconostoc gasicomitatum]
MTQKIDFHIHTIPGLDNKDEFKDFSMNWLKKYITYAGLDAIAITNHNLFDLSNFNDIRSNTPDIQVFPGMELSLNKGHVNIIGDNDAETIDSFCRLSKRTILLDNKGSINTEELAKYISLDKILFVFEFDKANSMSVPEMISDNHIVYGVTRQLKFLKFKMQHPDKVPVVFSDAHATDFDSDSSRNDISKLSLKNTFVQADSNSFFDLVSGMRSSDKVSITKNMLSNVYQIGKTNVSSGLNLIFGKRGTGKTVFLNSIKQYYNSDDIAEIKQFETAKTDEFLEQQQERFGNEAFRIWLKQRETTIASIKDWLVKSQSTHPSVETYLDKLKDYSQQATIKNIATQNSLFRATEFDTVNSSSIENSLKSLQELINNSELWNNFFKTNYEK